MVLSQVQLGAARGRPPSRLRSTPGFQHAIAEVMHVAKVASAADHVFGLPHLNGPPASIAVARADRVRNSVQRNAVGLQRPGINDHLVLLLEATDAGDLGDALRGEQVVADDPVLDAPQLGQRALSTEHDILVDPADATRARDQLEPVTAAALVTRLREGSVTLIDVRPEDEYGLGHLPGALNIPLRQLERRLSEIPRDREIVAYCRGPYCVLSFEAVAALRTLGFNVRRLEEGFPEWKASGLPVAIAA